MSLNDVLAAMELLDGPARGADAASFLRAAGLDPLVRHVEGDRADTDFVRVVIPGSGGRSSGGEAPTTGIVGRLGGIGARPGVVGLVSDGDGAVAALAVARKLGRMLGRGDRLPGDVVVATHVCPEAPTEPHEPVPFMGSPVPMDVMNRMEVDQTMEAVVAIDTTKGNRILNWRGIAITPTVMQGWILPVSPGVVELAEHVTGRPARVLPLSTYDITPYGNGLHHVNSILQPAVATDAPTVGIALTAETAVPGSATGASHPGDIAEAVDLAVEVARRFGAGSLRLFDPVQFAEARRRYGGMEILQTMGEG